MEEIQAESAAYYSYQTEDYQSDAGGGKIKTRRTRRVCLYPPVGKEKDGDLDFGVLTLEEIDPTQEEAQGCVGGGAAAGRDVDGSGE